MLQMIVCCAKAPNGTKQDTLFTLRSKTIFTIHSDKIENLSKLDYMNKDMDFV